MEDLGARLCGVKNWIEKLQLKLLRLSEETKRINKHMWKEEVFDFGFTAVTEEELDVVQKAHKTEASAQNTQEKIDRLYNAIQP